MGDEVSPWIPMKDPVDIKHLGKLIEELSEASAIAGRCLIQGIAECDPKSGKINGEALQDELADVLANVELVIERFMLNELDIIARKEWKKLRLREWHMMSNDPPPPREFKFDDTDIPF